MTKLKFKILEINRIHFSHEIAIPLDAIYLKLYPLSDCKKFKLILSSNLLESIIRNIWTKIGDVVYVRVTGPIRDPL